MPQGYPGGPAPGQQPMPTYPGGAPAPNPSYPSMPGFGGPGAPAGPGAPVAPAFNVRFKKILASDWLETMCVPNILSKNLTIISRLISLSRCSLVAPFTRLFVILLSCPCVVSFTHHSIIPFAQPSIRPVPTVLFTPFTSVIPSTSPFVIPFAHPSIIAFSCVPSSCPSVILFSCFSVIQFAYPSIILIPQIFSLNCTGPYCAL